MFINNKIRNIYYLCPDDNTPSGGILKIYDHVKILSENGYSAFVLHDKPGFRCSWFKNNVPIAYPLLSTRNKLYNLLHDIIPYLFKNKYYLKKWDQGFTLITHKQASLPPISAEDVLVIPEMMAYLFDLNNNGLPFIIFNQNAYYTFDSLRLPKSRFKTIDKHFLEIYHSKNLLGIMTVSSDNSTYLEFVYPHLPTFRIRNAIPKSLFSFSEHKKLWIAFMPRKMESDARQVINILIERNRLKNWEFYPIDKKPREEVAKILKQSAIYLSFSYQEGCPLPPAEAIASGCITIGCHGQGGKEYFNIPPNQSIEAGNILEFAQTIEKTALDYEANRNYYLNVTKAASEKLLNTYSEENEKQDVLSVWEQFHWKRLFIR
jgi:hypothetical protein